MSFLMSLFYLSLFYLLLQNCLTVNWLCGENACSKAVYSKDAYGESTYNLIFNLGIFLLVVLRDLKEFWRNYDRAFFQKEYKIKPCKDMGDS